MTTTARPELPEPELGYIETDKSKQPAFSARQMRVALQSAQPAAVSDEAIYAVWTQHCQTPGTTTRQLVCAFARAILALRPQSSGFQNALDIRSSPGWKLNGQAVPVLYTDEINGRQVMRDDVWLCTTEALRPQADHPDTARCIKARNDLNAAMHGEGALIDDLEHAVANACAKLLRPQAVPLTPASRAVIMATRTADGDADEWPEPWAYRRGWNDAEEHHHIRPNAEAK